MIGKRLFMVGLFVSLMVAIGTAAALAATASGENGLVVSVIDGEIWTTDLETGEARQLTHTYYPLGPLTAGTNRAPVFSPDGQRIAFVSNRDGGVWQLYVMNADGSDQRRVNFNANTQIGSPAWSPDGQQLAYGSISEDGAAYWIVDLRSGVERQLVQLEGTLAPGRITWSHQADLLAYDYFAPDGFSGINTIKPDGTGDTALPLSGTALGPEFHEGKLTFTMPGPGLDGYEVWVADADGNNASVVTTAGGGKFDPRWSPDGEWITFFDVSGSTSELFRVRPNGTDLGPLPVEGSEADWQPVPGTSLALVNPNSAEWRLIDASGDVTSFFYGVGGDIPLMGDWDCDGVDTVGMFRPSNGFAYLRNTNDFGVADIEFFYGMAGDVPLAGDWDNDGCDTLAIYRNDRVFVRNTLDTGVAEFDFYFGVPGDEPFAGDFDGDGIDTIGLYRDTTGFAYLRNTLDTGFADHQFFFGEPSDVVLAGDWDADGLDTVGVFRPAEAQFYLSGANVTSQAATSFRWGTAAHRPVAGAFDLAATRNVSVYFVNDQPDGGPFLIPVTRTVPADGDLLEATVTALLEGPTVAEMNGSPALWTEIPTGTRLLGLEHTAPGVVEVDLSGEFESGGGSATMFARLAQMTFTLTQTLQTTEVAYSIDGVPITVFSGEGIVLGETINRDYFNDTGIIPEVFADTPAWFATAGRPLQVTGLARVFEAALDWELYDNDGTLLASGFAMTTEGGPAWGRFAFTVDYDVSFDQVGTLMVFEISANDGSKIFLREHPIWLTAG